MTLQNRRNDILRLIESLDIPPSLYKNAEEKYKAITKYLIEHGFDAEMYPQGSFALGTVVRPSKNNEDANYDLDFICQVKKARNETTATMLWRELKEVLENSPYADKLTEYDKCFTIEYADINGIGFSIDIVPAADETFERKVKLRSESEHPELIGTSIVIPDTSRDRTMWVTNNPKGYRAWFERINEPYRAYSQLENRRALFESHPGVYASVEDIPVELERSSLQRVIQILKKHRDEYYFKSNDKKPISAIIGTLVAKVAETLPPYLSVFELLEKVLDTLRTHSRNDDMICKKNGKWVIPNPTNPEDNLADTWNDATCDKFFRWINQARVDLIDALNADESTFRSVMENAFGLWFIQKHWNDKYCPVKPQPITPSAAPKPWRN